MEIVELGSHYRVKKSAVDFDRIRHELWVDNKGAEVQAMLGYAADAASGVALWEEDGDHVILPRGYNIAAAMLSKDRVLFEDIRPEFPSTEPLQFTRELTPLQKKVAPHLLPHYDKLLCLGCGKGKTTSALWLAAQRNKKTLIIVDRDFLVPQWLGEILACFPSMLDVDVGVVQASRREIGEHFTIALVHTLAQQEFDAAFYDQFGFVIVDEAHCMGAESFRVVLPNFPGERLLLSATPARADGQEAVFMMHAGGMQPCYVDLTRERSSSWYFVHAPPYVSEQRLAKCRRYAPGLGRHILNRPAYETAASGSLAFNAIVTTELMKVATAGRSALVLGSRTEQLGMLAEVLSEHADAGLVTGAVKGAERDEAFNRQMIFATDKIASRALNIPRLDTLVLLYPTDDVGFLRQAVGRIDREYANKRNPIVLVFCHDALKRKETDMESAIISIDAKAEIRHVNRRVP
jgi:superfamily II DNA or RNA helicase